MLALLNLAPAKLGFGKVAFAVLLGNMMTAVIGALMYGLSRLYHLPLPRCAKIPTGADQLVGIFFADRFGSGGGERTAKLTLAFTDQNCVCADMSSVLVLVDHTLRNSMECPIYCAVGDPLKTGIDYRLPCSVSETTALLVGHT